MLEGWRGRKAAMRYGIVGAIAGFAVAVVVNFTELKSVLLALILYPLLGAVIGYVGTRFLGGGERGNH